MNLFMSHLSYPLPISAYEPQDHPQGEAIRIKRPVADPQAMGIMPGMEGDLQFDDGSMHRIRISEHWTLHQAGGELRIGIETMLPITVTESEIS